MACEGTHISNFNPDGLRQYNWSSSLMKTEEFSANKPVAGLKNGSFCVDGRSTKISKKRFRASKKVPTTVFKTDASNFRAMVEHFTGLPIPNFSRYSDTLVPPRPLPRRPLASEQIIMPTFGIIDTSTFSSVLAGNQVRHGSVHLASHMTGSFGIRPPCEGTSSSQGDLMAEMNIPNLMLNEMHAPAFSASF